MSKERPDPKHDLPTAPDADSSVDEIIERFESGDIEELEGEIDQLPPEQVRSIAHRMVQSVRYQGPLPPAHEFNRYEQVLPGAADRILAMAELEQKNRHKIVAIDQAAAVSERRLGFWVGAGLLSLLILATLAGFWLGMGEWALSFLGVGVIGLVTRFIPKHKQEKEEE